MVSSDLIVATSSYEEKKKAKAARVKVVQEAIDNLERGDILPEQVVAWTKQLDDKVGGGIDIGP